MLARFIPEPDLPEVKDLWSMFCRLTNSITALKKTLHLFHGNN